MEIVKVVKNIPGLLKKGDVLTSIGEGRDFTMYEKTPFGERKATVDYYTVSANIPKFFTWDIKDEDIFEPDPSTESKEKYAITRTEDEIAKRVKFFRGQLETFRSNEETVVYNNLLWFIDWLTGKAELLK